MKFSQNILSKVLLITFVVGFLSVISPNSSLAAGGSNLLIVFDASGSMLEPFSGSTRIEVAKSAVSDLLAGLDPSVKVGLRAYAHIKKSTQVEACKVTDLIAPFSNNLDFIKSKVESLQAVGSYTPTAYTLEQSAKDFVSGEDNTLVLLTDGKETCGGDPAKAAKALLDAGIKVKTYVIGLDVDSTARTQLNGVASAGGGKYFDATDAKSLTDSFAAIQEAESPIDKTNTDAPTVATRIRGGNGFDTAVLINPGKYQLDHHQRRGQYDYFKLLTPRNTISAITLQNTETPIRFNSYKGVFEEEPSPNNWSSIEFRASDRQVIFNFRAEGASAIKQIFLRAFDDKKFVYGDNKDQVANFPKDSYMIDNKDFTQGTDYVYLKVGDSIIDQHKDVVFTIENSLVTSATSSAFASSDQNDVQQVTDASGSSMPTSDSVADGQGQTSNSNNPNGESGPKSGFQMSKVAVALAGLGVIALVVIIMIVLSKMHASKKVGMQTPPQNSSTSPVPPMPSQNFGTNANQPVSNPPPQPPQTPVQ